jgi:1,4-dihydroxy-2-naphthoate octaprenyltransferase
MLEEWLLAARPKTLLASVAPVAIGAALAYRDGEAHGPAALAALVGAVSIQIGTNFCNDCFDYFQGADTEQRKGPTRAVQAGLITPRAMLAAAALMFSVTVAACAYLVWRCGWPLAVVGIVSVLCGIWYTAGPYSLAYLGLGDLFVLAFFGPIAVGGTYYVQALRLPAWVVLAGLAPGLLSVGLLVVNNLRDIDEDRQADKKTLAVRFGVSFARWEYAVCVVLAALVPVILWTIGVSAGWTLLACLVLVPGSWLIREVWRSCGALLNRCLGGTAGLLVIYTGFFCLGCIFPL